MKFLRSVAFQALFILAAGMPALRAYPPAMSVTAGSTSDTFVTPGPSNNLMGTNYGAAGAMEVSGTALSKGRAESVVQFDLAAAKASLDQTYGVNGWKIDGVKVRLTGSPPNNPLFNSPLNGGLIQVQWIPKDDWVEGAGTPMTLTTTGLTWRDWGSITPGAQSAGTISFDGTIVTKDYPLVPSMDMLGDIITGGMVSLLLQPADATVTAVFNTHTFGTPADRPALLVTASANNPLPQVDLAGPPGSSTFGQEVYILPNGNVVVPDSRYSLPSGATEVGEVSLYSPDGTLISRVRGSTEGDRVGAFITVLNNGNFVIGSPSWSNGGAAYAGAVTWVNGSTGLNDTVSASNSLVGTKANDSIGLWIGPGLSSVVALVNGNYVVSSPNWSNGTKGNAGAVTWCNGTTGTSGPVSAANSLVGGTANCHIGDTPVVPLTNGNYVSASSFWNDGGAPELGAVTWGNGTTGTTGTVSAANSLVGSRSGDHVGLRQVNALPNGHYVVTSLEWDNGTVADAGAVTWCNGITGTTGEVSAANSLVGSTAGDFVGLQGVTVLSNSNYVVASGIWNNGGIAYAGAVTWGNGAGGTVGAVSAANSLVGSAANDNVGSGQVMSLVNGNYVVRSPHWHNGGVMNAGAATWGNGTTGISGPVSTSNSLVGTSGGDQISDGGITALVNGNYVVSSTQWGQGGTAHVGAVTWGNGATGISGAVAETNSLVGSTAEDQVGSVTALTNGNYVVSARTWDSGALADAGAVTWADGTTGIAGAVSSANSITGAVAGAFTGQVVVALTNGHYVIHSSTLENGGIPGVGAVTWCNGTTVTTGTVTLANSLAGTSAHDNVGAAGGIVPLSNGHYIVRSRDWDRGAMVDAGAVTWCSGTQVTSVAVSPANSLVGSRPHDELGKTVFNNEIGVKATGDGRYVISSSFWDNGTDYNDGAVTLGFGGIGPLSANNSVRGTVSATGGIEPDYQLENGVRLASAYDAGRGQLVVGRNASQRVSLFNPTPGIEVTRADDTLVQNSLSETVSFEPTATGGGSSLVFTLKNPGLGDLTGLGITFTGTDSADFSVTAAPVSPVAGPRGTTTFTVKFAPTTVGTKVARLSIASNDNHGNAPYSFVVSGVATTPCMGIQFSDDSMATPGVTRGFGNLALGLASSMPVKIKNTGTGALLIASVTLVGADASSFALDAFDMASMVPANGETSFNVLFIPSSAGPRATTLRIVSNDPVNGTFDITVTGTGVAVAGTISFDAPVYTVNQGAVGVDLVVKRTGGTLPTSVTINTDDGRAGTLPYFAAAVTNAVAGKSDYVDLEGAATTVSFADGDTSKTVHVTLIPKAGTAVPNKRFTATLSGPSAGALLGLADAAIQILATDVTKPTLTIATPVATVSAASPYKVAGIAGDAHGIAKVTVKLNAGDPVDAVLGSAIVPTSVPYSLNIEPQVGANTLLVTATDLKGNATTLTRTFTFTRRYLLTVARTVPATSLLRPDSIGNVAMVVTPSTSATVLTPATANANPKVSQVLPAVAPKTTIVKLTATATTLGAFSHWANVPAGATVAGNVLSFNMPAEDVQVTAVFLDNPFIAPAGSGTVFQGLIHSSGTTIPSNGTEGYLTGSLANSGVFTGKILIDGVSQAFVAIFGIDGSSLFTVGRTKLSTLAFGGRVLTLAYNAAAGNNQITATLTKDGNTSTGIAARAIYSATHKVMAASGLLNAGSTTTGFYTVRFPAKEQLPAKPHSSYPQGDGFGTISINYLGNVTFAGTLADGTAMTASSALVDLNTSPVFAQLVTPGAAATIKGGSFGGVFSFAPQPMAADVTATNCLWFRPAVTPLTKPAAAVVATNLYTDGWPEGRKLDASGGHYAATTNVQTALTLGTPDATGNGFLAFSKGRLNPAVTVKNFKIVASTVTKIPATTTTFTLVLVPSTGAFSGTFTPTWASPSTVKPAFKGIILQKTNIRGGYGFFLSNATGDLDPESGLVNLSQRPLP